MPVARLCKFLFDDIAYEQYFAAAQKVGNNECCESGYEYHGNTADDTGQTQRENDPEKSLNSVCPQIVSRIYDVHVYFRERIIKRKYHKRQEVVNHAEDNGARRVDDIECGQTEKREDRIDDPGFFEKRLPCQCAEKEIHPHRQNKYHHDKAFLVDLACGQYHGQRIGKEQTDKRADKGQDKGGNERLYMLRRADGSNVFQGKGPCIVGQSVIKYHAQRDDDKGCGPEKIRSRHPAAVRPRRSGRDVFFHCFTHRQTQPPHLLKRACS